MTAARRAPTDGCVRTLTRPLVNDRDDAELRQLTHQMSALPGLRQVVPVSATKNYVLRATVTGMGECYLKTARTADGTSQQISNEQLVWEALAPGSTRTLLLPDGRHTTAVTSAGTPPNRITADLAAPLRDATRRLHALPVGPFDSLDIQTVTRTRGYLARRLEPLHDPRSQAAADLCDRLLSGIPDAGPGPLVLAHADTTMLNFVLTDTLDGSVRATWVDLETAVLAPASWDHAGVWVSAHLERLPKLGRAFLDLTGRRDASYDWSLRQVLASKIAWAAWRTAKGQATFREDLGLLTHLAVDHLERPHR